jgi:hypothetical protein
MPDLPPRIDVIPPDAIALALETAVPLWMIRLSLMRQAERLAIAQTDAGIIADATEALTPDTAMTIDQHVFSALARAVAFGALAPGGITMFGHHWCTDPECATTVPLPSR